MSNKKSPITPIGDRVVIKVVEKEETKSAGGIIIPGASDASPLRGKVIAVGVGRFEAGERVPMQVKVGDTVLLGQYGFDEVQINGEKYHIANEQSLVAIINED